MKKKEIEATLEDHTEWLKGLTAAQERTEAQIAETNKTLKELGEATDKRIGDLVSAIGKLIEHRNGNSAKD